MNIRDRIENTPTFQSFQPFKKIIYRKAANMRYLERAYNIASRIGYDQWKEENQPSEMDGKIVEELIRAL